MRVCRWLAVSVVLVGSIHFGCKSRSSDESQVLAQNGASAKTETQVDRLAAEWKVVVDHFSRRSGDDSFFKVGKGGNLRECSDEFLSQQQERGRSWSGYSSDSGEISKEDFLIHDLRKVLGFSSYDFWFDDDSQKSTVSQNLRSFLIRAAIRSPKVFRMYEGDEHGGFHCYSFSIGDDEYQIAYGGWS